jgi:hypothetical protein
VLRKSSRLTSRIYYSKIVKRLVQRRLLYNIDKKGFIIRVKSRLKRVFSKTIQKIEGSKAAI